MKLKSIFFSVLLTLMFAGCDDWPEEESGTETDVDYSVAEFDPTLDITYRKMNGVFDIKNAKEYDIVNETLLQSFDFSDGLQSGVEFLPVPVPPSVDNSREWKFENGAINMTYPSGMVKGLEEDYIYYSNAVIDGLEVGGNYQIKVKVKLDKDLADHWLYSNFLAINNDWQLPVYDSLENVYVYSYGVINYKSEDLYFSFIQYGIDEGLDGVNAFITDISIDEIKAKENNILSGVYVDDGLYIFDDQSLTLRGEFLVDDSGLVLSGKIFNETGEQIGETNADWNEELNEYTGVVSINYEEIDYLLLVTVKFNLDSLVVSIEIPTVNYRYVNNALHNLSLSDRFIFTEYELISVSEITESDSIEPFYTYDNVYEVKYREAQYQVDGDRGFINLMPGIIEPNPEGLFIDYQTETLIPLIEMSEHLNLKVDLNISVEQNDDVYCGGLGLALLNDNYNSYSYNSVCLDSTTKKYEVLLTDYQGGGWLQVVHAVGATDQEFELLVEWNSYSISSFEKEYRNLNGSLFFKGSCENLNDELLTDFIAVVNTDFEGEVQGSSILDDYGVEIGRASSTFTEGVLNTVLHFDEIIAKEEFYIEEDFTEVNYDSRNFDIKGDSMNCMGDIYFRM